MPFIGEDQVRLVKSRVDLVQLVSEYTSLRKSGSNFTACCPFHQERTPSFYVYPDDQSYHCFGCGAHGDAITLVREKERVDFSDAVELLARRAGVTIQYQDKGSKGLSKGVRNDLAGAVEFAAAFYERMLWDSREGAAGREYLAKRGLTVDICKTFRLGWAPGGSALVDEARRRGLDPRHLLATDLAVDRYGRPADRFYERVTFPICDRFGAPIAFSARLLPEAERKAKEEGRGVGKYINNTDTPLYHKGHAVFNLHRARTASRDTNRLLVMEGPTDVMAASLGGFPECVAALGTALTADHVKQLGNIVGDKGRLIIVLDGDRAGQANSIRAIRTCLSVGVPMRVATIPDEMDPAELLVEAGADRERGRRVLEDVLASARTDIDHLLRTVAPRPHELDHRARLATADQVLEALRPMPDPELRGLYLRDAAAWLGIERDRLERRQREAMDTAAQRASTAAARTDEAPTVPALPALDEPRERILHLLVQFPALRAAATDDHQIEPSWFPAPWDVLAGLMLLEPDADVHDLSSREDIIAQPVLRDALFRWSGSPLDGDPAAALAEAARLLRAVAMNEQLLALSRRITDAERARDFATAGRLGREKMDLMRALRDLQGQA
jgi:DNA primase